MNFTKNTIWRFCALIAVVILCSNVYAEESLYVISNMDIGELKAYEIDGNSLIFQYKLGTATYYYWIY